MILYTIMPEEVLYPADETVFTKQRLVNCGGCDLVVEATPDNEYKVVRILSSDPQHYLQYQPGQKVIIH